MESLKKILIFSTAYYPLVGGAEVAIKEITDRISDVQFDMITARLEKSLPKIEQVGNVKVYRIGVGIGILDKLLIPFWGALRASRLSRENHYSAYWCMMASFASGAAYIANIFSRRKVPIILTLQEGDSEKYLKTKWLGLVDLSWRMALRRADMVTAISSYLAQRAKRLGWKKEVEVIPNGVDWNKFKIEISEEEKNRIRTELKLEENDVALVTASRLNVKNGIGDVIKALKFLPEKVKFVICGTGELEKSLKLEAKSLSLENRIVFRGFVSHDELPKILKACDIFIRPSLSEGLGNSFIEAMAAGLPVIATPVGGITDFLKDGETGYFCQPQNPESVAEIIKKVVDDPERNKIVENAYKMSVEKYDWRRIAEDMKIFFLDLC